jgi:hypothetical protein
LLFQTKVKTNDVVIRTPCGADWNSMDPRGSARFCGSCEKLVHDLSALSEPEARALLRDSREAVCVRYLHDASGEIWFSGGQKLVPVPHLTRGKHGLAAAALAAVPLLFQACGGADAYGSEPYDAGADVPTTGDAAPSRDEDSGSDDGGEGGAPDQTQ